MKMLSHRTLRQMMYFLNVLKSNDCIVKHQGKSFRYCVVSISDQNVLVIHSVGILPFFSGGNTLTEHYLEPDSPKNGSGKVLKPVSREFLDCRRA